MSNGDDSAAWRGISVNSSRLLSGQRALRCRGDDPICEEDCSHVSHDLSTVRRVLRVLEQAGAPC